MIKTLQKHGNSQALVNGVGALPESDALEAATMAVASSRWDKEALTLWFREQPGETHR